MGESAKSICVVVLGDIGRSPRMQYHTLSLAEHGHKVDVVCYGETQPLDSLKAQPLVNFHYLVPYPTLPCPRFLNYILKTVWQALTLLFIFVILRRADIVIVQNPPAVPSLLVCWFYSLITRGKLVIDWHNYAHTIMALSVGSKSALVKITEKIECYIGRRASNNFCVTNAMKNDLKTNWGIDAITLYDRPPEVFRTISLKEKHELLSCLGLKYEVLLTEEADEHTVFTEVDSHGDIKLKSDRPGLLVSSTSWTDDEDFSVLFSALEEYENHIENGNIRNLSKLICIVTGKGPLKEYYCKKIAEATWKNVRVITPWLESRDYPLLLACADLGVCLHTSSSGLDLPMKVVDMFGCGLPVCAYDFNCLDELVAHGRNGYKFKTAEELCQQLQTWFENFPNNEHQNAIQQNLRSELKIFQNLRWRENWNKIALPIIE